MASTRDNVNSPTTTVSRASCGSSVHGVSEFIVSSDFQNFGVVPRVRGDDNDKKLTTACIRVPFRRYTPWEVGGGRATRQPGQVRKEAALTSSGSGRLSASHPNTPPFSIRRAGCSRGHAVQ